MGRVITVEIVMGAVALWTGWFFFSRLRRYLRWRRDTRAAGWKQALVILLPSALSLWLLLPVLLVRVPSDVPAKRGELREITAPVASVREYETRRVSRTSVQVVKRYRVYLEGYTGYLYVHSGLQFDQLAFLAYAGSGPVTFRYASTGGRLVAYEITREDDSVFLAYSKVYEQLLINLILDALLSLSLLLLALGAAVSLPAYLLQENRATGRRRLALLLLFAISLTLLYTASRPSPVITETPAVRPEPLTAWVEPLEGVAVVLPLGWQEGTKGEDGQQWYKVREKVSTCFRYARYLGDPSGEDWYDEFLLEFREGLLEDFIKKPKAGAFLEEYAAGRAEGTGLLVSEGWGVSVNGYKNHFLLALLPEERCAVVIQTSSGSLSYDELEAYVEEWIWPLVECVTVKRPAAAG